MAGSDRYSLIVESATRGEAELRRLSDSLNRISDAADKASARSSAAGRAAASSAQGIATSLREAIQNPLAAAGKAVEGFVVSAGKVGLVTGGIGTALGAIGLGALKLVHDVGDAAESILNLADRTGISVDQLDRLQAGAKIAGIDIGSLGTGVKTLATFMGSMNKSGDDARKTLQSLGVSFYDAAGNVRELGDVSEEILRSLGSLKSQQELVATATKLFGKGAVELLPLIRNYKELDSDVRKLGFGTRTELLTSLAKAGDEVDKLGLRWEMLKGKLAIPATAVVNVIASLASVFDDNRQPFRTGFGAFTAAPTLPRAGFTESIQGRIAREQEESENSRLAAIDKIERERLAQRFRSRFALTEQGRQSRLSDIGDRTSEIRAQLASGNLDTAAFQRLRKEFGTLQSEREAIERAIAASNALPAVRKSIGEFVQRSLEVAADSTESALNAITRETVELLLKAPASDDARILAASFRLSQSALFAASQKRFEEVSKGRTTILEREAEDAARALSEGRLRQAGGVFLAVGPNAPVQDTAAIQQSIARREGEEGRAIRNRTRLLELAQQQTEYEARRIELLTGPAGEAQAIERVTALRLAALDIQKQLGAEFDVQAEKLKVLQDAEVRRLELIQRQRDAFKESVGRGFDALLSGGAGGLRSFVAAQGAGLLRTITTNAAGELYTGVQGRFSLPGQRDAQGNPTLLGRLLTGTPFADNGLKTATDMNTLATQENTLALRSMAIGGGGTTSIPGIGTLPSIPGLIGAPGGTVGFNGPVTTIPSGVPGLGNIPALSIPGFTNASARGWTNQYGSGLATGITYAAALGAGTFGVISGIKQGGGRGALTAIGSGLGAAAALDPEPVSKAVLMIAAVAASFATQLLGDPKVKRGEEIDRLIEASRFNEPTPLSFDTDFSGRAFDTNIRGDFRPTIVVQALDARSIIERSDDIADAVRVAMQSGHRVNREMQQVVLAQ